VSAEIILRAAALMRERAESATPGRWVPFGTSIGAEVDGCTCHGGIEPYGHEQYCGVEGPAVHACEQDAEHIAPLATPGTALALAGWLDYMADQAAKLDEFGVTQGKRSRVQHLAEAVARAYLGESA